MVVPAGKVSMSAGHPSTTSPAAVPGAGRAPEIRGAGADGWGKPVGLAVTGGRTSRGLGVDWPSLPVPWGPPLGEPDDGVTAPGVPWPGALPAEVSVAPDGLGAGRELEDSWAVVDPVFPAI